MKICEGCIKQDVCKFKDEVEKYDMKLPEPLEPIIECKYKRTENYTWTYPGAFPCGTTTSDYTTLTDCTITGTIAGFN